MSTSASPKELLSRLNARIEELEREKEEALDDGDEARAERISDLIYDIEEVRSNVDRVMDDLIDVENEVDGILQS